MKDPVLVATDGGTETVHALQLAAAFASAENAPVEVVSVVSPLSDLPMPLPHRDELELAHAQGVADAVRRHLRDAMGPVDWPIHICRGRPAPAICTTARQRSARLVVLGVTPESEGNEVAVELLHLAEKPILVARDGHRPRNVVVGIDFRPSSLRAAELALRLMAPDGSAHLVHVKPSLDFPAASVWDWSQYYRFAVEAGFEDLVATLEGGEVYITTELRAGEPASALIAAAVERSADLLAIGSDGYICNDRVVVGRVARTVLTRSPVAVLTTPVTTRAGGPTPLKASEEAHLV